MTDCVPRWWGACTSSGLPTPFGLWARFTVRRFTCSSAAGPNPSRRPRRSSHFSRGCFRSWYSAGVHPRSVMQPERIHPYGMRSGSRGLVSPVVVQSSLHHLLKGCPSSIEINNWAFLWHISPPHLSLFLGLVFYSHICLTTTSASTPSIPSPGPPTRLPGQVRSRHPELPPQLPEAQTREAERNVCSVGCPFLHLVSGGLPSRSHPTRPFFAARLLDKPSQSFPINTHLSLRQHHSQTGLG